MLTKKDLTAEIARVLEVSQKDAKRLLEAMLDSMVRTLREGGRVEIRGFGSFATQIRTARIRRNPITGAMVNVPAKRVPNFKASSGLKTLLNGIVTDQRSRNTMPGTYEINLAKNGEYYFNLKAGNGEIILSSETYKAKAGAKNGIESVKTNSPRDERYERKTSPSGKCFFVLKAANHEVIGRSELYESESSRDNGIESVKRNGPTAETVDLAG